MLIFPLLAGGLFQRIDDRLRTKIQELVCAGTRSEREIRRHLKIFVERELYRGNQPPPQKTNRRFYPSRGTIRSHVYKSVIKERYSKIDQEDLQKKVEIWKAGSPDDNFEFHPYATYSEEENRPENEDEGNNTDSEQEDEEMVKTSTKGLLFVHQTRDQRRLLERYGNELSMLDATYKTTIGIASRSSFLSSRPTSTIRSWVLSLFKVRQPMQYTKRCPF